MIRAFLSRTPRRPAGKRRGGGLYAPHVPHPAAARIIRGLASTDPSAPFIRAADVNRATARERAWDATVFVFQLLALVAIGGAFWWGAVVAWAAS